MLPVVRVEVARGLVGQQHPRLVGQRAGDRDALLLAARQLRRVMVAAAGEAHLLEQGLRPRAPAARTPASSIGTRTFSRP